MERLKGWTRKFPERTVYLILLLLLISTLKAASYATATTLLYVVMIPWGFGMIARNRQNGGLATRSASFRWVFAALAVCAAARLINFSTSTDWGSSFLGLILCGFLLMSPEREMDLKGMKKSLFAIACAVVCCYLPFVLVALASVFTGRVFHIPGFPGAIGIQSAGSIGDRIRICANTNTVAEYAAFNILLSLYIILSRKNKALKVFFAANALLNFMALAHTQSRTSFIALAAAIAILAFRGVYLWMKKPPVKWAAGILAAALAFFLVLEGLDIVLKTDLRIAHSIAAPAEQETEDAQQDDALEGVRDAGTFDVNSNGRGDIWKYALKYLRNHPKALVVGVESVDPMAPVRETYGEENHWVRQAAHAHNSYIASVLFSGVPYLICILGLLFALVKPCWKMLMAANTDTTRGMFIVPVFLAMLLVMSLAEDIVFTKFSYQNCLFYIMAGFALRFSACNEVNQ